MGQYRIAIVGVGATGALSPYRGSVGRSLSPHGQCPIVVNHSLFEIILRPYKEEVISV